MTEPRPIPDDAQRERALEPGSSFIVQAPAGSGKTGLLVQRYLSLLARVERPEEILAITFSRKAAGEMRQRVLTALRQGDGPQPEEAFARRSWSLARAVLAHAVDCGWELIANPNRLRIQTIDSFCAELTRQLPLSSGFGAPPAIAEDATELYGIAARRTLAMLESGESWSGAVERLIRHLDNDLPYIEDLLADMLARRDHWLRHVADRTRPQLQRQSLEAALGRVVADRLVSVGAALPQALGDPLASLARYAAGNLAATESASPIRALRDCRGWPAPAPQALPQWRGLATLLLTGDGKWRTQARGDIGFPPAGKVPNADKDRCAHFKTLFGELTGALAQHPQLASQLAGVRELPDAQYTAPQWSVLEALIQLLILAVAQLQVVFREHSTVDFAELALAASQALGEPEAPTDLALSLDYRIGHILVDEFQDTSLRQYELLARLTGGWMPGDGRTLFVVGDPMQSIYRFREAEVGLYLQARRTGLEGIALEPLALKVNFRSQEGVVEWVNGAFPAIFPALEDPVRGAVRYSPCRAHRPELPGAAVAVHPLLDFQPELEAQRVVALIQAAREEDPEGRIAILVRSRTHLAHVLPTLRQAGIGYHAVEIDTLAERPVVQDLLALTRALVHPADRIAWLAILRAPWCGLTLADLEALAGGDRHGTLWDRLCAEEWIERLSSDGQVRALRLRNVLARALAERRRRPLRRVVEGTWLALGGPAAVEQENGLGDAAAYLYLLDDLEHAGDLAALGRLDAQLGKLYAAPDEAADERLQVMTIHKAKGLEFDTVVLPGLGRRPNAGTEPLLRWMEVPRDADLNDLLLAPIRARGADPDPISRCLKYLDAERGRNEDARLLYVAATRAKRRLHLIGHCPVQERDGRSVLGVPASGSLLETLWPVVAPDFEKALAVRADGGEQSGSGRAAPARAPQRRLAGAWQPPPVPAPAVRGAAAPDVEAETAVEFDWVGETARSVGIVVHGVLQRIGRNGPSRWDAARVRALGPVLGLQLTRLGVPREERAAAQAHVLSAVQRCLSDERGRWVLDDGHSETAVEWALSGVDDGRVIRVVLDRTFVDAAGVRWIIDYKTGAHAGPDVDAFLDTERERYRTQLERYAALLAQREQRPIRLGLYFPLLQGWREWDYAVAESRP